MSWHMLSLRFVLLTGFLALTLVSTASSEPKVIPPPHHKIYHGVSIGTVDETKKTDLEDKVGKYLNAVTAGDRPTRKNLAWVLFDSELDLDAKSSSFPGKQCETIFREYGAIPYIRLLLKKGNQSESEGTLKFEDILDGQQLKAEFDKALCKWQCDAETWGKPLLVEWGSECNACWSPWNKSPGKFKNVYMDLVAKISPKGRNNDNITWVFHIDATEPGRPNWGDFCPDKFDWIGVSVYGLPEKELMVPFRDQFVPYYESIVDHSYCKCKPIIVSAFGCPKTSGPPAMYWTQHAIDDLICDPGLKWVIGFSWWNATYLYRGRVEVDGFDCNKLKPVSGTTYLDNPGVNLEMQMTDNDLRAVVFQRYLSAPRINHWPRILPIKP